ncbi:MAG: hypothetical protein ACK42Y_04180 [Candidatus Thermochlorobacter sp.]
MLHTKTFTRFLLSIMLSIPLLSVGCSKKELFIEGEIIMSYANANDKVLIDHPVFLMADSVVSRSLEKWREGFRAEMKIIDSVENRINLIIDSLRKTIATAGKNTDSLEKVFMAYNDTLNLFYKEKNKYRADVLKTLIIQIPKLKGIKTNQQGKFRFDAATLGTELKPGKYVLMSGYDAERQSGILFQTIELGDKPVVTQLTVRDIDPVLNFYVERGKEGVMLDSTALRSK